MIPTLPPTVENLTKMLDRYLEARINWAARKLSYDEMEKSKMDLFDLIPEGLNVAYIRSKRFNNVFAVNMQDYTIQHILDLLTGIDDEK